VVGVSGHRERRRAFPGTIAGISLATHWGGGLYWLAPTVLLGIAGGVYSAWVLLVEIVR
jgi:hypothetical protein